VISEPMPALQLEDVRKVYRSGDQEVAALDHATLTVPDDEILALVGPSGSGKTTLLSIAGGSEVGFVFQAVNLVPFLTARENLLVVAEMSGRLDGAAKRRAATLLEELGLGRRTGNLPDQLSGGERQRVAIGRALMNDPSLVLFDEPTSALDTTLGAQVMELIRSEVKGRGIAAVIVTHDTRMTEYADRTVEIIDGRLAA
jgi:putative ABC transport system ATP-binding protein